MDNSRRNFFKRGLGTVAAVSVAQLVAQRTAFAADMPHVDPASPQAQGLGYVHDAASVDKAKYAQFKEGSNCNNCQFHQGAAGDWVDCALFPNNAVAGPGWCVSWAAKAG